MQTHKSQQFRKVLQNPLVTLPILMFYLSAAHSWFNQVKSLFGVKKSLLRFTQFIYTDLPPDENTENFFSDLHFDCFKVMHNILTRNSVIH
jgi:hypothetical protein